MEIFKRLNKKGYKHYYDGTVEELDSMDKDNQHLHSEIMQVVMWLYEKHGIWVNVEYTYGLNGFSWKAIKIEWADIIHSKYDADQDSFNSPTEAYEKAIEHVFKNLL